MFGWLRGSKLRVENDRLREEVATLKAAQPSSPASPPELVAGGGQMGPLVSQPNLGAVREQLRHFRDWQFVAISAIAKKVAAAELCVGYTPTTPAGLRMKAASMAAMTPEVLPDHPLLACVDDPNEALTRWQLLYVLTAQLCLTGRAYLWFKDDGEQLKCYPLPPDWVQRDPNTNPFNPTWIVRPRGSTTDFRLRGEDVAFFSLPDPADPTGSVSPLGAQASAVNLSEAISSAHVATMQQTVKPSVLLTVGRNAPPEGSGIPASNMPRPELTPEQRTQLIRAVLQAYAGASKQGVGIIDGLIESIEQFAGNTDVDWQNGAAIAKSRIFQAYGVHPFITGEQMPGSYAQMTAAERTWLEVAVNPLLKLMGEVLSGWLAPKFIGPNGAGLKVWFKPCVARDDELDLRRMQLAASKPKVVKVNELRAFAGLPALDESEGGEEFVGASQQQPAALPDAISPAAAAAVKAIAGALNPYSPPPARINGQHSVKPLEGPALSGRN